MKAKPQQGECLQVRNGDPLEEKRRLDSEYALPFVQCEISVEHAAPWTDHPPEKALELALANQSAFIQGLADMGKSCLVNSGTGLAGTK